MANSIAKDPRGVKRLLRREGSQEYFKQNGWTVNVEEALTFSDSVEAAETCVRCDLRHVELVLRMETAECDVFCISLR